MSAKTDAIVQNLMESIINVGTPKTSAFDSVATVVRVDGDTAWVHFEGGAEETPARMTVNAKEGDVVQVRVSNNEAFLVGNGTAPPTDDTKANYAQRIADSAIDNAITAAEAANDALDSADVAKQAAVEAQNSADNANEYATRALGNLSTVQSVSETLTWITQHGTMTLTTDTELDPSHVYFIVDENGDYVVGNTHYSLVIEPKADDLATYYVLSIDESLNNYVATHLALTDEGLWILPNSTGNKILIATGSGSTYTTAGSYIIDADGEVIAFFGPSVTIGSIIKSHISIDGSKLIVYGSDSSNVASIGTRNNPSTGIATITESSQTNTSKQVSGTSYYGFYATLQPKTISSCTVGSTPVTAYFSDDFIYSSSFTSTSVATVTYTTEDPAPFAIFNGANSAGVRSLASGQGSDASGANAVAFGESVHANGKDSVAEGYQSIAFGTYSHAEGSMTQAKGEMSHAEGGSAYATGSVSHAEGINTVASGVASHAQNNGTIASGSAQTAIGNYNVEDFMDEFLFIIGKGTDGSHRSNAFTVDWNGVIRPAGGVTIDGKHTVLNNTNLFRGVIPSDASSTQAYGNSRLLFQDFNGDLLGTLRPVYTEDFIGIQVSTYWDSSTGNSLILGFKPNGDRIVYVTEPATWRTALGIAADASWGSNKIIRYKKQGNVVTTTWSGTNLDVNVPAGTSNWTTVATIPSGYRPSLTVYTVAWFASSIVGCLRISSSGDVDVTSPSAVRSGSSIRFSLSYVM